MNEPLTPRALADSNPAATDALLLALINASPAVLYSCKVSADCGTIAVTENVRSVLGYAAAEFINDPSFWALRVHPDDSARVFAEMPRLFREGAQTIEYRFRHADGSYRWLRDQMRLEFAPDGRPARILGCWLDITEEKRATQSPKIILSGKPTTSTTTTNCGGNYAKQT